MKYSRTLDVKRPTRGTELSAGLDFYVPDDNDSFRETLLWKNPGSIVINQFGITINPHSHVLIPSGIKVNLQSSLSKWINSPYNALAFIAHNKSSIGIRQLSVAATVIDMDYQGCLGLSITNTSNESIQIKFGQKLVQFLLMPIIIEPFEEEDEHLLFDIETSRGLGGFGSTGSA